MSKFTAIPGDKNYLLFCNVDQKNLLIIIIGVDDTKLTIKETRKSYISSVSSLSEKGIKLETSAPQFLYIETIRPIS